MDRFTTWFKKRVKKWWSSFASPRNWWLVDLPVQWAAPTWVILLESAFSAWGCGEFLRPQKLVLVKKGSHVPRWMTFFFPKIRQFSKWQDFGSFFAAQRVRDITVWRFSTSRGGQWTFPAREGQCLGQRLYACEVRYHSNGVDKGMMMLM